MEQNEDNKNVRTRSFLLTMAGNPPVGDTTTIMLHLVSQAALKQRTPAAYFSPGMSNMQVVNRLIAINTGVDYQKIAEGTLNEEEWKKLDAELPTLINAPLYIDDTPEISLSDLSEKIVDLAKNKGVCFVVVDPVCEVYTPIIEFNNEQQRIDHITGELKKLSEDLGIVIFMVEE